MSYVNKPKLIMSGAAERFADAYSDDQTNDYGRGVELVMVVSALGLTNEIQSVTVDATSGTYTLTYAGQTTAALDFDAAASAVQAALEALSNIGAGNVSVTGGPGDSGGTTPYLVEFIGDLANTNVAQMTATDVDLAGGGDSVAVATTQAGGAAETPSVTLKLQGKDQAGNYYDLLTAAAVTTATRKRIVQYPGIAAVNNVSASDILPFTWRAYVAHGDSDGVYYSVFATVLV